MIAAFSYVMLGLGAVVILAALVYILGFVVSALIGAGYVTVDAAVHHHGHDGRAHAA